MMVSLSLKLTDIGLQGCNLLAAHRMVILRTLDISATGTGEQTDI